VHNEEACVGEFVRRTSAALRQLGRSYEIVVVSDGSTDRTEDLLRRLVWSHPELRAVLLSRNTGQCNAIYAGIQESVGDCVVVMDGDLQHEPEEIHRLIELIDRGHALVSGSRSARAEGLMTRRIPSAVANWMLRRVTGCPVRDMGGFKALRGDIARDLRLRSGHHRLLPALVWMRGGSVAEISVSSPPRFAGQSHYGVSRAVDVLFDILMLWFQSSFKSRPIYLFGRVGLMLLLLDIVLAGWLLYDKLVLLEPLTSRPLFFVVIMLFLAALFTLASGFMLEMLSDALNTVGRVRPYLVRERLIHPSKEPAGMVVAS
jgi:glycosyltransferase involved in cell wall biosynthesis